LIEITGNRSLGGYPEESLVANNKAIRNFLEFISRKYDSNISKHLEHVHHRI
jgi:hypothetical protein